jgi:long-chain acyl-CoA synthetase
VGDERWSFRDHDGLANAFARHLGAHGVGSGDRVAVMTSNRVEVVAAVHAVSKFGAAAVLLSPAWKAVEVDHALGLAGPRHAVADGPRAALLTDLLGAGAVTDLDDPLAAGAALGHSRARPVGAGAPDTDDILVFRSGHHGLPKAVRHTQRSIGHATSDWCTARGLGPDDRFQWRHRRPTSSACSTCSPRPRPARPSGSTGGSSSTRCCVESPPSA